jgi:hypothetical protein
MPDPIVNILKLLFGGGLTRTGIENQDGSDQTFYDDPSQAGAALAHAMRPMAQPQTSDIAGELSAPGNVRVTGEDYVAPPAGGVGPRQDPNAQYGYDPSADRGSLWSLRIVKITVKILEET